MNKTMAIQIIETENLTWFTRCRSALVTNYYACHDILINFIALLKKQETFVAQNGNRF